MQFPILNYQTFFFLTEKFPRKVEHSTNDCWCGIRRHSEFPSLSLPPISRTDSADVPLKSGWCCRGSEGGDTSSSVNTHHKHHGDLEILKRPTRLLNAGQRDMHIQNHWALPRHVNMWWTARNFLSHQRGRRLSKWTRKLNLRSQM